jgi:uncharacterized membrane protein
VIVFVHVRKSLHYAIMNISLTTTVVLPLRIGVVAGLRAMTAPAAVSWAARIGWLNLAPTSLAFLGYAFTPWVLTALALAELVTDQLPSTPSRTVPAQFGARLLSGGLSGAAIKAAHGGLFIGLVAGILGAVIGTLGGARVSRAARECVRQRSPGGIHRGCGRHRRRLPDRGCVAMKPFDAIIIEAGQAGPPLAGRLTTGGMTVALVERKLFCGVPRLRVRADVALAGTRRVRRRTSGNNARPLVARSSEAGCSVTNGQPAGPFR